MTYVETSCTIELAGQTFEAGGAVVTPDAIVAYLGPARVLTDWHAQRIGTYRIVSSWTTPRSTVSERMHQVEAVVDGVTYTGRSAGLGMIFKGKRKSTPRSWATP